MQAPRYALVSYVKGPVGEFLESLRRELHPALPYWAAHITILPPRVLQGTESQALETLEDICSHVEPFDLALGEVETFIPVTPTVFVRVGHAATLLCDLHDRLNVGPFTYQEEWPYMPHLTIVKMSTEEQAHEAYRIAYKRWAQFQAARYAQVRELTFVREDGDCTWVDLAGVPLGRRLVSPQNR